jgi:hypothetical protein
VLPTALLTSVSVVNISIIYFYVLFYEIACWPQWVDDLTMISAPWGLYSAHCSYIKFLTPPPIVPVVPPVVPVAPPIVPQVTIPVESSWDVD